MDQGRALEHLMDLLAVEGTSGREGAVARLVREKLLAVGCRPSWIGHDTAHRRIASGWEVGNLVLRLPGTRRGSRRLFMGHMDTVPLCRGAVPVRRGRRIVARGKTALGGDNRTSVACLVTLVETLLRGRSGRPPLTVLLTVGEEVGLRGSREVRPSRLGQPAMGFNIDSGDPRELIVGAIGADRWEAEVLGRSAHAGVHPERGISAALIASRAIEAVARRGFFGKIEHGRSRGTSNVGCIEGGEASNQVTDRVLVRGESRSHDSRFLDRITAVYREAFEAAARSVTDHRGRGGRVRFRVERAYDAYRLADDEPTVRFACDVARSLRLRPKLVTVDGGLDASNLSAKGIPTLTVGAGQHGAHTLEEYVDIDEYLLGCRLVCALATASCEKSLPGGND